MKPSVFCNNITQKVTFTFALITVNSFESSNVKLPVSTTEMGGGYQVVKGWERGGGGGGGGGRGRGV